MQFTLPLTIWFFAASVVACHASSSSSSPLARMSTFTISPTSPYIEVSTTLRECAENLPDRLISSDFCFDKNPVATIHVALGSSTEGQHGMVCVDTYSPGKESRAAAYLVNANGDFVGQSFGNGNSVIVASTPFDGEYKIFAGLPKGSEGKNIVLRIGRVNQFLTTPPCSIK